MRLIDLNHVIEDGMSTYPGLPGPTISDHLSREASRRTYAPGTEFHIARIDMVANTGTYLDAPSHRYANGVDVAGLSLDRVAALDGMIVDARDCGREIGAEVISGVDVGNRAVLFRTGWDQHWRTDAYEHGHPFLSSACADRLVARGAVLVGIDSLNIDDTATGERPVHTRLLAAGILIVEHLCNLDQIGTSQFAFFAVPPRVRGMGTFPVRAFALLSASSPS